MIKNSIGETIRKVSIDKSTKTISLLVLDCISQNEASLKIETYDYDMNFQKAMIFLTFQMIQTN